MLEDSYGTWEHFRHLWDMKTFAPNISEESFEILCIYKISLRFFREGIEQKFIGSESRCEKV